MVLIYNYFMGFNTLTPNLNNITYNKITAKNCQGGNR